ncbi:MAG: NAD(P)-dependent alcohol dehydrogenase [Nitrososphaerales archaeon]|jgi:NADPH:quinone reductase-like Zn-dependent oxidoreductase
MKAIVCPRYGPPDVLQLKEVEKPVPEDGRVLVKIHATSANPVDWHHMTGAPFLVRLGDGLRRPKDPRLGTDIAGTVEAVGSNVTQFKPGDEVFGACVGGFAEYGSAREDRLVLKPANVSFDEAAAVPVAAITALQGLRDSGKIQVGQKVLINGASGGVGTFAVQIAKSFGAEVTGVCSTRNLEMVRFIGADRVIDYTQEDFTEGGERYDLIYDTVGNHSVSEYKRALRPKGRCVVTGFSGLSRLFEHAVLGPLRSRSGDKKVGLMGIAKIDQKDLGTLKELLESRKVVPVIDRRYPLSETPEAIRYLQQGHARGKVVILVDLAGHT